MEGIRSSLGAVRAGRMKCRRGVSSCAYDAFCTIFLACPDAWWPELGVAVEVDSREYHLSPEDHERTLARHARMAAHGITVLHFTPRQIRTQPAEVAATIKSALTAARGRPALPIRTIPPSA